MHRDALWVDEPDGPRWQLALELLASGVGSVLKVRVQTNRPGAITPEHALAEIENAEAGISEIRRRSAALPVWWQIGRLCSS